MYCSECGETMQWRSTNNETRIAKYKCQSCGNVVEAVDDYKAPVNEAFEPKNYTFYRGRFIIHKTIDGVHRSFGTYGDEETCKKVRDKLKECDWDKSMLPKVYEELGIKRVNRVWVCV